MLCVSLLRLIQFGLMARERQRWFEVKPLCDSPEPPAGTSFISIAIDDTYPALYLITFGAACSCILLLFESIIHYRYVWIILIKSYRLQLENDWLVSQYFLTLLQYEVIQEEL